MKCNLDKYEVMHMGNKLFQLYICNDGFLADYYHMEMSKWDFGVLIDSSVKMSVQSSVAVKKKANQMLSVIRKGI